MVRSVTGGVVLFASIVSCASASLAQTTMPRLPGALAPRVGSMVLQREVAKSGADLSFGSDVTPTMERQRAAQALLLREKVSSMVAQNGGALTEAQEKAVGREARAILRGR